MIHIASRVSAVKTSASMAVSQTARQLRAQGVDVIDLSLGEPDFSTPNHIIEAAYAAARAGETRYTAPAGVPVVREMVADKFRRENGLDCDPEDVIVANGTKQIIFDALLATLEPRDEVVIPAPYFVSYPEMVKLLGGSPVIAECPETSGFRLTPEALQHALTPKTKWLLMNTPCNPSGVVYSRAELRALGATLASHPSVLVLSDEIYEHIVFAGREFVSFAQACPELKDRMLTVNGVSKAYAMTGWRVGYATGPRPLIEAMATIQSQSVTSVCTIAQAAAVAALTGPQDEVTRFREAFERRRNLVVGGIRQINALTLVPPEGAFYAYIGCANLIGRMGPDGKALDDDVAVASCLLNSARVAAVPGAAYGMSPFFRISTATSDTLLAEAITRIKATIEEIE